MKKYSFRFLLFIGFMSFPSKSFSQLYCNTNDGRQVILHDNGTWQYVPNSPNSNPTTNNNPEPGLDGCEDFEFGNVGFRNNTGYEIFVVISLPGSSYSMLQIPPSGIKWQKELRGTTYYFRVFTEKPAESNSGPYYNNGYKYQGEVNVLKCKNKTIEIDF